MMRNYDIPAASKHKDPLPFRERIFLFLLLAGIAASCGCGGNGSGGTNQQSNPSISANWQFTMSAPSDGSFLGGLQGGFLLQSKGSVTGSVVYSIALPPQSGGSATVCNSGSAPINGTINGQTVTLTAMGGTQTFTLTGTLSADGTTIAGTYSSTDGNGCGTAQTGLQWSAVSVPPLNGAVQGSFHSTGSGAVTSLKDQDFPITGSLSQGPNIGASNATITGTLTFQNYPCMATASVNGQISGNTVILQLITPNGLNVGQIGSQPGNSVQSVVTVSSSASGGLVLQGEKGYGVSTNSCKAGNTPGDVGNICLAFGSSNSCTQPITLTPAALTFPAQFLASTPTTQTLTLTNTDPSGMTLNGLQLGFRVVPTGDTSNPTDFDLLPSFAETDNCSPSLGTTFSLASQQSCTITVSFSPQQGCPWLPLASLGGAAPSQCPPFLPASVPSPPAQIAILTATSPTSADVDNSFAVPVSGVGLSALEPSTPELDFGAEAVSESSAPQVVTFVNQGPTPVLILPPLSTPPCGTPGHSVPLPRPLTPGSVPGIQVVTSAITPTTSGVSYVCDVDLLSNQPNFQITADGCSGTLLSPQQSCIVSVVFAPQPETGLASGLDYFLELNTLQCTSATTSNCEIDSGRFPVELKANLPSPLRMQPGAGLDFGPQPLGTPTVALTVTLFNDPADPNSQTVNFGGNIVKGDYSEIDNCGSSLAPGNSCVLNITFKPGVRGFDQGSLTITYNGGQTQTIYLRGTGQ
jgi:hypothetical protein